MKRKPLLIQLIALGYVLTPFTFLIQYFMFSKKPFSDAATWMTLANPYKLSFLIIPPIVAIGIYKIRPWGWYLALVHLGLIVVNNMIAWLKGSRTPTWAIWAFTAFTFVVLITFVRKTIREPYFNPRVRWWETKPRFAMTLQVALGNDRTRLTGETFNISEGGMFMVSDASVSIDEKFSAKLSRNGGDPINCEGQVVWVNPAGQSLPQGFGFMFTGLDRGGLAEIRRYIKDQKQLLRDKAVYR